MFGLLCLIYYI